MPEEYWAEFLASATRKRHAAVKFRQRILPRWYKLIRGGVWHIGALSCHNAMNARKHGWRIARLRGASYHSIHAPKETARNNHAGAGDEQTSPAFPQMQSPLWRDVGM